MRRPNIMGLRGLIQQLPESWTTSRRAAFIEAFVATLDLSVEATDEEWRPSANEFAVRHQAMAALFDRTPDDFPARFVWTLAWDEEAGTLRQPTDDDLAWLTQVSESVGGSAS